MEEEKLIIKKNSDDYISANAQRYEILSNLYNMSLNNQNYFISNTKNDFWSKDKIILIENNFNLYFIRMEINGERYIRYIS